MQTVLIVGAGPTGLTLALTLARNGIRPRIIDKVPQPAGVSKALAVWSGSLEAFGALGVIEPFVAAGRRMDYLRIGDGSREIARMQVAEGVDSAFPFTLLLPQSRTEALLEAELATLGITVERGLELTALDGTGAGGAPIMATLTHAGGESEQFEAAFVVGCDGARSIVRHAIGSAFEGYTEPHTFILSDSRIEGDLDPTAIYLWWGSSGSVALFPVEDGIWRLFAMRDEPAREPPQEPAQELTPPTLAEIQAHLDSSGPPGLRAHGATWLSAFHVNARLATSYRKDRVLLAGDAAHIHSPAGGQGMNTGIQDAVNLGWKLAAILQWRGREAALLDSYEAERRPIARDVVAEASQKLHVGMVQTGPVTRLLRDTAIALASRLPMVRRKLQAGLSETRLSYQAGPLCDAGAGAGTASPAVGERALDAAIIDPTTGTPASLWSRFSVARHTLLLFGNVPFHPDLLGAAATFGPVVDTLHLDSRHDPDGKAAERYGIKPGGGNGGWVLVRPDQFIAARGEAGNATALNSYAREALSPRAE